MLTRSWLLFGFYIIDSEYGTSVQAGKNKTIFTFNLDSINFFFFNFDSNDFQLSFNLGKTVLAPKCFNEIVACLIILIKRKFHTDTHC